MQHKLSNKEIEQMLGQRYAQLIKETPGMASVYRDCEEVIQGSLALLEHYNKVTISLKTRPAKLMAGV